jgi:hypothetical protein
MRKELGWPCALGLVWSATVAGSRWAGIKVLADSERTAVTVSGQRCALGAARHGPFGSMSAWGDGEQHGQDGDGAGRAVHGHAAAYGLHPG